MEKFNRIDGKNILPELLKEKAIVGSSIIEDIILASSNKFREYLNIPHNKLIKGPINKCVTRKDPSLDNYCADLILRTCYEPISDVPVFEEHLIRDSEQVLSSELNPRLQGAILIGIGGQSENRDFVAKYDEHDKDGKRVLPSATQVVIERHLLNMTSPENYDKIYPLIEIINKQDSEGGSSYDSLNLLTKNLHYAQFKQPGFVIENLSAQWKRSIIESTLLALMLNVKELNDADTDYLLNLAKEEIDNYTSKRNDLVNKGFLIENIKNESIDYVSNKLLGPIGKNYLTFKEICFALRNTWDKKICSFIISFFLESAFQLQQEYFDFSNRKINEIVSENKFSLIYYEMGPQDMLPNRPILGKLNKERKRGVLIVYNPYLQITAIFHNNFFFPKLWKRFVDLLREKEPKDRWYTPTSESGEYAAFVLNGTRSFVGVKMTELKPEDYAVIFKESIKNG